MRRSAIYSVQMGPLNPWTISLTLALGSCLVLVPRRWAALPILAAAILIPPDQRIVFATLDFNMLRILVLFGLVRLLLRGEMRSLRLNVLDGAMIGLISALLVVGTLQTGTMSVLVNRLGRTFDSFGVYFYMRTSLRKWSDLRTTLVGAMISTTALASFMAIEWSTGSNLFSALGGVSAQPWVRDGTIRCQGAFSHPFMAGIFGASWVAPCLALWWRTRRKLAVVGVTTCALVVFFSGSSTPLPGLAIGLAGFSMWPFRRYMRFLRWSAAAALVFLHFYREKPIWHLMSRLQIISGAAGYHRYVIVDRAIAYFDEWWLLGTRQIAHWGIYAGDITNYYVATGLDGGLLAVLMLVALLVFGCAAMGRAAGASVLDIGQRQMAWALGVTVFAHAVMFLGAKYFGQMNVIWYLQMAMVGSLTELRRAAEAALSRERKTSPRPSRTSDAVEVGPKHPSRRVGNVLH